MFSSLFKPKGKRSEISVSDFLNQSYVQMFIKRIRKVNASEAQSKIRVEEWARKREQAIKNNDIELLGQLCDEMEQKYAHIASMWHQMRRRQIKLSARLEQDYFPDNS